MAETDTLPSATISSLTPEAKAHWKLTGEIKPSAKAPVEATPASDSSTQADSSPAEPAAQAVSTEPTTQVASEPATPKKKSNAETRLKELLEENKRLKADLETRVTAPTPTTAGKTDVTADSSPAPVAKTVASLIDTPDLAKPPLTDVEFFTEFPQANAGDFTDYRLSYREAAKARDQVVTTEFNRLHTEYHERIDPVIEANPEIWDRLPRAFVNAKVTGITLQTTDPSRSAMNDLAREIFLSPEAGPLLQHFAEHPEEMTEIAGLPNENAVVRAVARVAARVTSETVPSRPVTRPKVTTSAPDPGTTLGRRTLGVVDSAKDAVVKRDMRNYKAIKNAEDVAARSGSGAR